MRRKIDQWKNCEPEAMAEQSKGALVFAFQDAKADIVELHSALERLVVRMEHSHSMWPEIKAAKVVLGKVQP